MRKNRIGGIMAKLITATIALLALSATTCLGVTASWGGPDRPLFLNPDGVAAGTVTATPAGTVATETPTVQPTATPLPPTATPRETFFIVDQGDCAVAEPTSAVAPWWLALMPVAFFWIRPRHRRRYTPPGTRRHRAAPRQRKPARRDCG